MKNIALSIIILIVLFSQFISPTPVHAEDEMPSTPTGVPVETSTDAGSPLTDPVETTTPVAQTDTSGPMTPDLLPVTSVASEISDGSIPEQTTLLGTTQLIPNETNVVVLDVNGQAISLASQEAVEVIAQSDPIWCPSGQAPTAGANGCTAGYATLEALVRHEGGNIAADGTIWITSGIAAETNPTLIESSLYSNWSNYALTLQGGWSGLSGDISIGSNSVFSTAIFITGWNNNLLVDNITIANVTFGNANLAVLSNAGDIVISDSDFNNNNISTGAQLLAHNGNIEISNSNFNNNGGALDNPNPGIGATVITEHGNITINNSNFNGNSSLGLRLAVNSSGDVIINNSSFSNNHLGAQMSNKDDDGEVTLNNVIFGQNTIGVGVGEGSYTFNSSIFDHNETVITVNGVIEDEICQIDNNIIFSDVTFIGDSTLNDPQDDCALNAFVSSGDSLSPLTSLEEITGSPTLEEIPEFSTACSDDVAYSFDLSNGDLVTMACLDNTVLPAVLPPGYTYISAFSLSFLRNEMPISVLSENEIKFSFMIPAFQEDSTYSILYWDNGTWISLRDFFFNEDGNVPASDTIQDTQKTLNISEVVMQDGSLRIEGSTTFSGLFILAQH